jgi:hypothetical protein
MRDLDNDISIVERRIARERHGLSALADDAAAHARETVASPPVLAAALAVGFVLADILRAPRAGSVGRKAGLAGLLTGAVWSVVKMRYGSPIAVAQILWGEATRRRASSARPAASPPSANPT